MKPTPDMSSGIALRQYHLSGDMSSVASMLPAEPSPFVGRLSEIQVLRRALLAGPKLVFLTGPGGIGKSSLAVAVCHYMVRTGYFEDGILWVDGREVASYGGVLDELAQQLGHHAAVGRSLKERERHLIQQIADHNYLVVVDDLDGLEGGRRHTIQFLRQLPGASLVTARLHPPGLDLPERVEPMTTQDTFQLLQAFIGRTLDYEAVEDLLKQVGGSPLATQLVAAQVVAGQDPSELADKMIHAPTGQLRLGRFHGQTPSILRAFLVAWAGLTPGQQELLLAASLLRRSFTVPLITYILNRDDANHVRQELKELHRRGLMEHAVRGWRIHDALVEVLASRVTQAEEWHLRAAAARAMGSLEDQLSAIGHLTSAGDIKGAAHLLIERSAELIETGLGSQLAEQMAGFSPEAVGPELWLQLSEVQGDVAVRLGQTWEASHYYARAMSQIRHLSASDERQQTIVRLVRKQAETAFVESRDNVGSAEALQKTRLWLQRATRLITPDHPDELVRLLLLQSHFREQRGELRGAVQAAQHALRRARRHHVSALMVTCYWRLGELYRALHQDHIALTAYDSALALAAMEENPRQRAALLTALGEAHRDQGNWIEAIELLDDSLPYWREASLGESLASTLYQLGSMLVYQGRYGEAQRYLQEAQIIARRTGLPNLAALTEAIQADALFQQGERELAAVMLQNSLKEAQRHLLVQPMSLIYRLLAQVAQQGGESAEAEVLYELATIWARRNSDRNEYHRVLASSALFSTEPHHLEATLAQLLNPALLFERARLHLRLAELLLEVERERAQRFLVEANDSLSRLGARPELERVARLYARLRGTAALGGERAALG